MTGEKRDSLAARERELSHEHPIRHLLCRVLNHGCYAEREVTTTANGVTVSALVLRRCGRGHVWTERAT